MKKFENEQDVAEEVELAEWYADWFGMKAERQGEYSKVDYLMSSDTKKQWVECRVRNLCKDAFDTYRVTASKMLGLWYMQAMTGHEAIFLVRFLDAVGYLEANDIFGTQLVLWGRKKVMVYRDQTPCLDIPMERFKWLC